MRKPFCENTTETPMSLDQHVVMSARFLHPAEVALVEKAARLIGMTPSAFLREIALKRAGELTDRWDVREMKRRVAAARKETNLRVIEGGRK